ncbi:ABC transporter permease [Fusibacter sp. 3D3]|uniref:ABC transporter permease n=1 Tax=Fusibacter sp. 3D3 TaxID=1048380 RepID=UPI001586CEE0|nr:ABC transporter permease [Fusibacter sp. 3D3]
MGIAVMVLLSSYTFLSAMESVKTDLVQNAPCSRMLFFGVPHADVDIDLEKLNDEIDKEKVLESNILHFSVDGLFKNTSKYIRADFYNDAYDAYMIKGKKITRTDHRKIILPKYFSLDDTDMNQMFGGISVFEDYSDDIGKEVEITFLSSEEGKAVTEIFEIVGVYDNAKSFNSPNEVLISANDLKHIRSAIYDETQRGDSSSLFVIAKNYDDLQLIKNEIHHIMDRRMGIFGMGNFDILTDFIMFSKFVLTMISLTLLVVGLIYISVSTLKSIDERATEIGILKVLGYQIAQIKRIFLFENLWMSSIALIIGLFLYFVGLVSANYVLSTYGNLQIKQIHFLIHPFVVLISVVSILLIISLLTMSKLKHLDQEVEIDLIRGQ